MKTISKVVSRSVVTLTVAGLALVFTPRTARADLVLPDFQVDQTTISSCPATNFPCVITADKMTGNYNEAFVVTGVNTFSTEAYWDLGQFVANDGTDPVNSWVNSPIGGYEMYALFATTGTFSGNAATGFTFVADPGPLNVELILDPNSDTTKSVPFSLANTSDDVILGFAGLASGIGVANPPIPCNPNVDACGNFTLNFNPFALTPDGSTIFTSPLDFYLTAVLKGQFNSFDPTAITPGVPFFINGSADAWFSAAPEPATMTLLGIGLFASGLAARRRRKAQL
jgi:hypothetical protein